MPTILCIFFLGKKKMSKILDIYNILDQELLDRMASSDAHDAIVAEINIYLFVK
jgi:hypothetical protein